MDSFVITVIDFDTVSITNLTRSVLFRESDIGKPKVKVACQRALEINPEIAIQAIYGDLEFNLGIGDVREHDVIIGCLDRPVSSNRTGNQVNAETLTVCRWKDNIAVFTCLYFQSTSASLCSQCLESL